MRQHLTGVLTATAVVLGTLWPLVPLALPSSVALAATEITAQGDDSREADLQAVMAGISKHLFAALDSKRAAIRRTPDAVYPLVNEILLPHFDVEYATQLVLAQYWRTATPDQRQRFTMAFYRALVRTYGSALADATADQLKILPFRGDIAAPQVTVRTEVTRSSGGVVPVDYRLRRTPDGWKAFDVVIEGISYVRNYRADLDAEIAAKGLDAVILRIETQGLGSTPSVAAGR